MKKVLILEGSPRRNGNSAILSEEFARGTQEAGDIRGSNAMTKAYELGRACS